MGHTIIHKDDKFNIYCSIMDDCIFTRGVHAEEIVRYYTERAEKETLDRIEQAAKNGVEGQIRTQFDSDLDSVVSCNQAELSTEDFIKQFLS